jgi:hypothetical protein
MSHRPKATPKGWHDSTYSAFEALGRSEPTDRLVACGDCDWKGKESDVENTLFELDHLHERLTPGDPSPVGECPSNDGNEVCAAFVYYDDIEIVYRVKPDVLEALAACAPGKSKRVKADKIDGLIASLESLKRPRRRNKPNKVKK